MMRIRSALSHSQSSGRNIRLMIQILHYLRTLNCGNNGIFLIMGNVGLISSTVGALMGLGFGVSGLRPLLGSSRNGGGGLRVI